MGYDLMIADGHEIEIITLPFYWLARLLAFFCGRGAYCSITRGRHDIIWRREPPQTSK
jgi:hypothetical protein